MAAEAQMSPQMRYYYRNREECKRRAKAWAIKNPDKIAVIHRKKNYGISNEEYHQMLVAQQFACKTCGTPQSKLKQKLHVDHSHKTGQVRGLLCKKCNTTLGLVKESAQILRNLISYLEAS